MPATTLADVAQKARVSPMTVSNVINGKAGVSEATRRRVLQAIEETGYAPIAAARRAGKRTDIIGMVAPDLANPWIAEIVSGVGGALNDAHFGLLLYTTGEDRLLERERVAFLSRGLADGVIASLSQSELADANELAGLGLPVVLIEFAYPEVRLPLVSVDNYDGARRATEHLISLGHTRIGHVSERPHAAAPLERLRGYREALLNAGLPYDPDLVEPGDFVQPGGFAAAARLLDLPEPPTAIFAANDLSALGALDAIRARGLSVPEDVSLVGFDDIPMARHTHPALTTVRQPLYEMGQAAARMMLSLVAGTPLVSERVQFPTELILRGSTAERRQS